MTVQELIEKLKAFPPHWNVELSAHITGETWLIMVENVTNKKKYKDYTKKYRHYTEISDKKEVVVIY